MLHSGQFRGQKSLGPLKMSLEMAHKVIVLQKINYVPQFLKQRYINSYNILVSLALILLFYQTYRSGEGGAG